ncbi:MAG: type I glyceraldehyde-3-phosphate dehydrogenase [Phycisphaeraceae bacterium]|nr:MAG: type I glyceraldehyde-3-phosphate dehydrogenase [Phycisphaeraceae bacterium]
MTVKIGINGFGRIGRLVYRAIAQRTDMQVVAVNDLVPADNLAYLLKYDTMHGRFRVNNAPANVSATENSFTVNGYTTKTFAERDPAALPWKELGIDYVIESTGLFTKGEDAAKHIEAGAKRVLISAPTKTPDTVKTLCYKVNHENYDPKTDKVVSNASCTTNCLAPITKVIVDSFGLAEGLMTTVHAATATQPTQDGPSKKDWRGGRNAYQNIIPASTGAAKAVALCIPAVKGKLTGMAFRVPTADVSAVDLTFKTEKATNLAAINAAMKAAAEGPMKGVLGYTDEEVASSDFIGDPHSSIFDAKAGIELNDHFFKVVSWYDNESGYANRCIDMLRFIADND